MKWKVQEKPTGRYASFFKRGWPQLFYPSGELAASIVCEEDYRPYKVKTGEHAELGIIFYSYVEGAQKRKLLRLHRRFTTLASAKEAAAEIIGKHPEWRSLCES